MLANKHGWDANQVGTLTLAQIDMYVGDDAQQDAAMAQSGGSTRVHPKTGHRIVSCGSDAEAAALIQSLKKKA